MNFLVQMKPKLNAAAAHITCDHTYLSLQNMPENISHPNVRRPDMTFAVDWVLKNNYASQMFTHMMGTPYLPSCCTQFPQRSHGRPSSTWSGARECLWRSSSGARSCPRARVCSSAWLWSPVPPGTCSDWWELPPRGLLPKDDQVASLCHAHLGERERGVLLGFSILHVVVIFC